MSTLNIPVPTISTGPKHMTDTEAAEHYLREMRDRTKMLLAGSGVTALVNRLLDDVLDAMEALNTSTDTPTLERVTLTAEERDALAKGFSTRWAEGLCEEDAEFVQTDPESVAVALDYADRLGPVVERILAAREQALREEIRSLVTASKVTVHGRLTLADTLTDWLAR